MSSTESGRPAHADTHAKALEINLDPGIYGSIAEIGAGQEVARWFLSVGGASGTVAQSISAYDKLFSDATYGAGTRYVSEERLRAMLDREYGLLVDRLGPDRGGSTRFFAFAETASARNYKGDNEQHAWVGLRFQDEPGSVPSEIVLHVHLCDPSAPLQQDALGTLGVNLVHAAFKRRGSLDDFLCALWDELSLERMEVDVLRFRGPASLNIDPEACCLQLLRRGMAHAVVFDSEGQVAEPAGVLRKRPLIINRGLFETVEPFHEEMMRASEAEFRSECPGLARDPVLLPELSLQPFVGTPPGDDEILERVESLRPLGSVIVSDFGPAYLLAQYVRRFTSEPVRFVMGVSLLARVMDRQFYDELPGDLLEGLGKLLSADVKLHAYPMPRRAVLDTLGPHVDRLLGDSVTADPVTADDLHLRPPVGHLYRYLREAGWVIPIGEGGASERSK